MLLVHRVMNGASIITFYCILMTPHSYKYMNTPDVLVPLSHIMTKVDPITATGQHTLTRVCNYVYTLDTKQGKNLLLNACTFVVLI